MSLPPDDERTVLVSGNAAPSDTPAPAREPNADNVLPTGTRLGEFEITGLLGVGGFGIVYLAYDSSLERHVALKEYMPSAFAARSQQLHVSVKSDRDDDMFEAGLRSFVNEARILAQFDHPSLIKVYRFWEANGTAYMVMPYYQGPTLKQVLLARAEPPDEAFLKELLAPLLDTLALIHAQQCFHRDIAPDNILMLADGRPLLLDFGAARRAISGMQQQFTVIVKHGYAPIEQYAEMPGMSQGAWTDLFALASVVHFAIDGKPPPPAVGRSIVDPYEPLAQRHAGRFSAAFLAAIDRALAVKPGDRPQNAAELRALLGLGAGSPAGVPVAHPPPPVAPRTPSVMPQHQPQQSREHQPHQRQQPAGAASPPNRKPLVIGVGIAAVAALAMLVYMIVGKPAAPPLAEGAPSATLAAAPVAGTPPATTSPTTSATAGAAGTAPAATAGASSQPGTASSQPATASSQPAASTQQAGSGAATGAPFNPASALAQVVAGASAERGVTVQVDKPRVLIGKDRLNFSVRASHAGYVYVLMAGTDGAFSLLFPNAVDKNNQIAAGQTIALPRRGWSLGVFGPAGTDRFVAIVSDSPRSFGSAGLVAGELFSEFPLERARAVQNAYTGATPLFAGTTDCAGACPATYGASMFTIEEFGR